MGGGNANGGDDGAGGAAGGDGTRPSAGPCSLDSVRGDGG